MQLRGSGEAAWNVTVINNSPSLHNIVHGISHALLSPAAAPLLQPPGRARGASEPAHFVGFESCEAHVVAADATVTGWAGRARSPHLVRSFSYPVAPGKEGMAWESQHSLDCACLCSENVCVCACVHTGHTAPYWINSRLFNSV